MVLNILVKFNSMFFKTNIITTNLFLKFLYLKFIVKGDCNKSIKIIYEFLKKLKLIFYNINPISIIENSIYNILIPIKIKNIKSYKQHNNILKGITLENSINEAFNSIYKTIKLNRKNSNPEKLVLEFSNIYNKQGNLYFSKIQNLKFCIKLN